MTGLKKVPCRFFNSTGCNKGNSCTFDHVSVAKESEYHANQSQYSTLPKKQYPCRFFMSNSCTKGANCFFSHDPSLLNSTTVNSSGEDDNCAICYEKPSKYGLLLFCNHTFCIDCVRMWRKSSAKQDLQDGSAVKNAHMCPICRTPSPYVVPSFVHFPKGGEAKEKTIELYRASLASTYCKYFIRSSENMRFCPFGDECLYNHPANDPDDGVRFVFGSSFHKRLLTRRHRRINRNNELNSFDDFSPFDLLSMSIAFMDNNEVEHEEVDSHGSYYEEEDDRSISLEEAYASVLADIFPLRNGYDDSESVPRHHLADEADYVDDLSSEFQRFGLEDADSDFEF